MWKNGKNPFIMRLFYSQRGKKVFTSFKHGVKTVTNVKISPP